MNSKYLILTSMFVALSSVAIMAQTGNTGVKTEQLGKYTIHYDRTEQDKTVEGYQRIYYYLRDKMVWSATDLDGNGQLDTWYKYNSEGNTTLMVSDNDGDGSPDEYLVLDDSGRVDTGGYTGPDVPDPPDDPYIPDPPDDPYNPDPPDNPNFPGDPDPGLYPGLPGYGEGEREDLIDFQYRTGYMPFSDDFDYETFGEPRFGAARLQNWIVERGFIDILNSKFLNIYDEVGLCININGGSMQNGPPQMTTIVSKDEFHFRAGTYGLTFDVLPRCANPGFKIAVKAGKFFSKEIELFPGDVFETQQIQIYVEQDTTARIGFRHIGEAGEIICIDNIRIERLSQW